jgi:hypothetical protein
MWSVGVCLYLLLTQRQPFVGKTPDETRALMMSAKFNTDPLSSSRSSGVFN